VKRWRAVIVAYARRSILEWTGYRSFLLTLVFNQSIAPLLGFAVWSAALPGEDTIPAYFVALLVVQWSTASQEYYTITVTIYDGALNDELLRPHPQIFAPIAEGIAYRIWNLVLGLPLLATIVALAGGAGLEAPNVLMAMPAVILAVVLHFLFTYILCLSALWLQQAGAVTEIGSTLVTLIGGIAIPIMLLPDAVRRFITALPFRAMAGFPAEIASGQLAGPDVLTGYVLQVGWIIVFVTIARAVWRAGVQHYSAIGG
jgi:ABC-2 type transport system permease protein